MTYINKTEKPSRFEIVKEIMSNGTALEFIYIEGIKCGTVGYTNKADRKAAINVIQKIVDNSTKEGMELAMEVAKTITMGASIEEEAIDVNEAKEVVINHESFIIDFIGEVAYRIDDGNLKEYVNLNDMDLNLSKEAVETLLVGRIKIKKREEEEKAMRSNYPEEYWDDEDEDDDDYDSWYC